VEARDRALETGADGVDVAKNLGNDTLDRAKSVTDKLSNKILKHSLFRRGKDDEDSSEGS